MGAGRDTAELWGTVAANAATSIVGAAVAVSTLMPAWVARQIEQAWCDAVVEFSGWACSACAIPMAHTNAAARIHTALAPKPRFAGILTMLVTLRFSAFYFCSTFFFDPLL